MGNQQTIPQGMTYDHVRRQVHAPTGSMPMPMGHMAGHSDYQRRTMMSDAAYGMDYSGSYAGLPADSQRGPGCAGYRGCGPCGQSQPAGMCMTVIPDDPADGMPDGPAFNAWPCSTRDNAYDNKDPRGDPIGRLEAPGVSMHAFANAATDTFTDGRYGDTTHPGYIARQHNCGGPGGCR